MTGDHTLVVGSPVRSEVEEEGSVVGSEVGVALGELVTGVSGVSGYSVCVCMWHVHMCVCVGGEERGKVNGEGSAWYTQHLALTPFSPGLVTSVPSVVGVGSPSS